jgi:hypothetical protein
MRTKNLTSQEAFENRHFVYVGYTERSCRPRIRVVPNKPGRVLVHLCIWNRNHLFMIGKVRHV